MAHSSRFVRWFEEIGIGDVPLVGGKNASLGEMYRELSGAGVRVPNGFAITADAYRLLLRETGLGDRLRALLGGLDTRDIENLRRRGQSVRDAILAEHLPAPLEAEIVAAYERLSGDGGAVDVAVRSSATAEDLPDASFAGQQETYLNVQGRAVLLEACRRCFASLFTDRAISYRADKGFDHFQVALSIGVQRMVRSDLASSGVMFSIDTETGFRDVVLINAAYGLGENVVQGAVNPDEYYVFKPTLKAGFRPILQQAAGHARSSSSSTTSAAAGWSRTSRSPPRSARRFALADDDILTLARWACVDRGALLRERGASRRRWTWSGRRTGAPASCSSCRRGPRPCSRSDARDVLETYRLQRDGAGCSSRAAASARGSAQGPVRVIEDAAAPGAVPRRAKCWSPTRPIPTGSRS